MPEHFLNAFGYLDYLNLFTGGRHTKGKSWLILLGLLALTIPLHGYWYATSVIDNTSSPAVPTPAWMRPSRPQEWCGGSFFHHARHGWVGMPEHFLNAFGYLDLWMWVYQLYG